MTVKTVDDISRRHECESHDLKTTWPETSGHLENIDTSCPVRVLQNGIDENENESPHNPRNWPHWKKNAQILRVAFHSMMGTFMAAGIIPAYDTFAEEYHVTVPVASYLTSLQVRVKRLQWCSL